MSGLKMGVEMTFFGLKQGQDLENQATHPLKNSLEYFPPQPPGGLLYLICPVIMHDHR